MPKKAAAIKTRHQIMAENLADAFPGTPDPWPELIELAMTRGVLPHKFGKPASRLLSAFVIAAAISQRMEVPLIGARAGRAGTGEILKSLSLGLDLDGIKDDVAAVQAASLEEAFADVKHIRLGDTGGRVMDQATEQECDLLITTRSPNEKGKAKGDLALIHVKEQLQRAYETMDHPDAVCPLARMGRVTMRPLVVYVPKLRPEQPAVIPAQDLDGFLGAIDAGRNVQHNNRPARLFQYKARDFRIEKVLNEETGQVKSEKIVVLGDEQADLSALRRAIDNVVLTRVFLTHAAVVVGRDGAVTPCIPLRDTLCADSALRHSGLVTAEDDHLMGFLKGTFCLVDQSERYAAFGNDHDTHVLRQALSTMVLAIESAPSTPMFESFVDMLETEVLSGMERKDEIKGKAPTPLI